MQYTQSIQKTPNTEKGKEQKDHSPYFNFIMKITQKSKETQIIMYAINSSRDLHYQGLQIHKLLDDFFFFFLFTLRPIAELQLVQLLNLSLSGSLLKSWPKREQNRTYQEHRILTIFLQIFSSAQFKLILNLDSRVKDHNHTYLGAG